MTESDLISRYAERVTAAQVYDSAVETPLDRASRLSDRLGNTVLVKREDLQPVFSFKCRGAQNRIARITDRSCAGVICCSAGNHAQGVALAAKRRGMRAVVVMPTNTARIKTEAVAALGGEVDLHGNTLEEAFAHALERADQEQLEFIHPFADPDVIAGQGTIATELAGQWPAVPDALFVPIGGGGLIGGIGAWIRHNFPDVRIIGVEPADAASMDAALRAGGPTTLDSVGIFADGVAVRRVSDETFALGREVIDEIILVDTDETCAAIKDIFEDFRVITEPAGALAVAGLKRYAETHRLAGRNLIAINSGANIDFNRLRHVAERAEIGEHREAIVAVSIPERKGAFLEFCRQLGRRSITEFNYRFAPSPAAHIFVGIALSRGRGEADEIVAGLVSAGYRVLDLTDNELAKVHIRHMVGGYLESLTDERLYRFVFPERPGALLEFLEAVGARWNISLFHYRNHGADYGRVLAGIQVPDAERNELETHLASTGFPYWPETENAAYRLFLAGATD